MTLILPTREKQKTKLVLPPRNFKVEKPFSASTTPAQARSLEAKDIMDSMIQSGQAQTSTPIIIPPREKPSFFEPTEKVRARDIIRELPGAVKDTGVMIAQSIARSFVATSQSLFNMATKQQGKAFKPETELQKKIFGTDKEINFESIGRETADIVGAGEKINRPTAIGIGLVMAGLDITPMGGSKKGLQETAKTIAKLNKADDIVKVLKNVVKGEDNIIRSLAEGLASETDPAKIEKILEKVKTTPVIKDPLAQEATKYKSAEEFVKNSYNTNLPLELPSDIKQATKNSTIQKIWNDLVETKDIPISELKKGENYQTTKMPGRKITEPIIINKDGLILDGHNRVNQAIANSDKTIKAKVVPFRGEFEQKLTDIWNKANKGKQTLDDIFKADIKPEVKQKIKSLTGKEQLEIREAQKIAREEAKLQKEGMKFYEETLEEQYQNFKKLITPGKLDEIEDATQLKSKVKAEPAVIDNILYSQTKNESEVFDMFKERRLSENFPLPQVPKETKAIVAEKARQTVMSAKEKVERRRQFVKIAQRQFELSDNDVRKISQKDVRNMGDYEYKQFLDNFRIKAMELAETRQAKNQVIDLIRTKELQRVDALRRAMKLPPIEKMNIDDLGKLEAELEKAQVGDVFLTQRELETVKKTDLGDIKTIREAREKLAQELKIPVTELENIKVAELDRLRFDTALAEKNPFYKMMVEETHANLLKAEEIYLGEEKIINDLVVKARKSVKRGIIEKAIPTDDLVFDYLSGNTKLAEKMTKEELELANYLQIKYADALEYLIENKVLTKGRSNYITNTRRGFLEAVKDGNLKQAFTELLDSYKQDEQIFQILDQSTKEILPLEKFFQFSLQRTGGIRPTKNIAKATETYFKVLEKKKALDALIPKIDIYVQSLTPQRLTPKGLEMDRRLKTFVNEWLNNKKGRRTTLIAKQGGKIDIATNAIRSFLYFKDLALSLPIGLASLVGEQVSTFVNIGNKLYLKGISRYASKQGRQIIDSYKNFIGKNIWEELAEPAKNIGDKFTEGMFGLFQQSTVEANKIHLLGSLTDAEFKTGKISTQRLAEMKLEIGKYRMLSSGKSIIGSTPEGQIFTQYKTWAIPIFRSVSNNLLTITKNLTKGDFKKTFTSKELKETLRAAEITTAVILLGNKFLDEEDDSYIGKLTKRLNMEALTILGALDTKTMLAAPRLVSFIENLGKAISSLIKLEEYKTKEGYIGVEQLKKELRPGFIRQFKTKETVAPRQKELDKIFNRGADERQSLEQIFK